jgi:hypothetical protein
MSRGGRLAALLMMGLLLKHLLSNEYGPFDRFLEIGIFAFFAYEIAHGLFTRRKAKKRATEVAARTDQMFACKVEGQKLWHTVPSVHSPQEVNALYASIRSWESSVQSWIMDTNRILQGFSPLASATFLDDAAVGSGTYDGVPQQAMHYYRMLNQRLINLRAILESPDRYF